MKMPKKIKPSFAKASEGKAKKELERVQKDLEKTGEALGDLFKGIFKGVGRVLEVAKDMEEKGEEIRTFKKEIKGITKSGKEFKGETGWRVGFLDSFLRRKKKEDK